MNIGTDDVNANNNSNDENDAPDGSGKAYTMLVVMDLDNYELYYNGYAFSQPAAIMIDATNITTKPYKTNLEAAQGQVHPP